MDCICSIATLKLRRGDSPFGLRALGDPTVNAMMWDAEGTLWVMTNSGGVSYMTKQLKRFDYYSLISLSGTLELGREIGPLCEDQNGNIWVGTRNGLCFFNTQIHSLSEYTLKNVDARYDHSVACARWRPPLDRNLCGRVACAKPENMEQ